MERHVEERFERIEKNLEDVSKGLKDFNMEFNSKIGFLIDILQESFTGQREVVKRLDALKAEIDEMKEPA